MDEREIRGGVALALGAVLTGMAADQRGDEKESKAQFDVAWNATGALLAQLLVDVNRIANALESVAKLDLQRAEAGR